MRYGTRASDGHRRACARGARAPALTLGYISSTLSFSAAKALLTSRHWPLGERSRATYRRARWHTRARAWTTRVRDVARDGVSTGWIQREGRIVKEWGAGALGRPRAGAGSGDRKRPLGSLYRRDTFYTHFLHFQSTATTSGRGQLPKSRTGTKSIKSFGCWKTKCYCTSRWTKGRCPLEPRPPGAAAAGAPCGQLALAADAACGALRSPLRPTL